MHLFRIQPLNWELGEASRSVVSVSILGSLWLRRKELRSQRCGAGLLHSGGAGFELSCLRSGTKLGFQDIEDGAQRTLEKDDIYWVPRWWGLLGRASQLCSPQA